MQQAKSIGAAVILLLFSHIAFSQQLKLGNNPYTIEKSAILELQSTNQGLLFPRIADTLSINTLLPPDGMVVFHVPTKQLLVRTNGAWRTLINGTAIISLNGLTASAQTFNTGVTGTDFNITSAGSTHTFNIPDASATARGLITTGAQTIAGTKTFTVAPVFSSFTAGSIPFIGTGGLVSQSNANFFWDATNNRLGIGTTAPATALHVRATNPLTLTGVQLGTSTTSDSLLTITNGLVRKLPMSTFATPITTGNLTEATSSVLTITGGTGAVIGSGTSIQVKQANSTQSGFLSSTDWNTFNNKLSTIDTTNIASFSVKVRSLFGAGTGISYNTATGVFANTGVLSVNGNTGVLTMDTTYIASFSTKVRSLFGAGTGINYDPSTGVFSSSINTGNFWTLGGNGVTSVQNLGTTSNFALPIITNNVERMRVTETGLVGIGITTPATALHVRATNPLTLTGVQLGTSTTTDSLLTITNGLVRKLPMSTFATPITTGNLTETGSSILTITGGTGAVIGSGTTLQVKQANSSQSGFLSSADWNTFNNKLSTIDTTNIASFSVKVRSLFGSGTGLSYNTSTGVFANAGVLSVNGNTGVLTMDTTYIASFSTKVRSLFGAGTGINYDPSTGVFSSSINTGNFWTLGGNGVASAQNLGTTTNFALPIITNNVERMRVTETGLVGIGITAPATALHVRATNPLTLTGVQLGTSTTADSLLTITNGLVRKLPMSTFATPITTGNLTETGSSILTITGGTGAVIGSGTTLQVKQANSTQNGFLSNTDWTTFNNKLSTVDTTNIANFSVKVRSLFSAGTGITYNAATGIISATPAATTGWLLTGNTGTTAGTNFIGTTDNQALIVKTNNTQVGRFDINSTALGIGATTNNATHSFAFGNNASTAFSLTGAMAIGTSATVSGSNAFAIGTSATANSPTSFALGSGSTIAFGLADAMALGTNATANGNNSIAIGSNAVAAAKTTANGIYGMAFGTGAVANGGNSIAMGYTATVGYVGSPSIAIGNAATNNGANSVGLGTSASIGNVTNATALGSNTSVGASNSTAIGYNTAVTQSDAIILGDLTNTNLSVGIGSESFTGGAREKLLVDAGASTSYNVISGKGNVNNYLQLNIQNRSNGNTASSDLVATADNGSESGNYVDLGINSSGFNNTTYPIIGGINNAYLYSTGNDFVIGNATSGRNLQFFTGGYAATNERLRIDGSGNVGVNNTAPTEKMDITGNLKFSGALMPNNTSGTAGFLLQSNGSGTAPTWVSAATALNSSSWLLDGNNVTALRKLGTTSNFDLPLITNNVERARFTTGGFFGINTTAPAGRTHFVNDNSEFGNDYIWDDYGAGTTQGLYFRKARGTIASPANVQNGDILGMMRFTGRTSGAFSFTGGTGIDAFYKGTGTNDLTDMRLFTSNTEHMRIDENGNVAIGATSFDATNPEQLLINAGTTNSVNALYAKGSINSYFQINIQNQGTGTQSSSDIVATANNGTETTNFINMGINGSNYQYQLGNPIETGKANDGYLLSAGSDFYLVNNNSAKDMIFLTGGTANTNEAMRITSTRRLGIATTAPTATLDAAGTYKMGAKGSVNKNEISFATNLGTTALNGGSLSLVVFSAGSTDISVTIPTALQPTSTQATVVVSPAFDLPSGVSIASARLINTTTVRVRFVNANTAGQSISGNLYITITEF